MYIIYNILYIIRYLYYILYLSIIYYYTHTHPYTHTHMRGGEEREEERLKGLNALIKTAVSFNCELTSLFS